MKVAPLVGAWIEIDVPAPSRGIRYWSLPSWERGLKCPKFNYDYVGIIVAPLVGAWIEIWSGRPTKDTSEASRSPRGSVD